MILLGTTNWSNAEWFLQWKENRKNQEVQVTDTGMGVGLFSDTKNVNKYLIQNENVLIAFNGVLGNYKEIGFETQDEAIQALATYLPFHKTRDTYISQELSLALSKLAGSFVICCITPDNDIWIACTYKPLWLFKIDNEFMFTSEYDYVPLWTRPAYRVPPYTLLRIPLKNTGKINLLPTYTLKRTQHEKALVVCSSGLDSTTVAAYACAKHGAKNVTLLHFDYGCKATKREKERIILITKWLKCNLKLHELPSFGGSSLLETDDTITSGDIGQEYAHEWVPARNLLMLSTAVAFAEANKFGRIYIGTNAQEAGAYPDNEKQFIIDFNFLLNNAVQQGIKIEVSAPVGHLTKSEIIKFGKQYNTPYHLTWSCYRDGENHCGKCAPCLMRKQAFEELGEVDPVKHEN